MTTPDFHKSRLRKTLRQRRRAITPAEQAAAARAAADALPNIPGWTISKRIGLYLSADGELDTTDIADRCRAAGKVLYLPRVGPQEEMEFAQWDNPAWSAAASLQANRYGIPEPPASAPICTAAELDLLFLPLVGWDRSGNRLGMGGGYYDRTLADARPGLLVGLAHSVQEVKRIPVDTWDIRLDYVLTEQALHRCGDAGR